MVCARFFWFVVEVVDCDPCAGDDAEGEEDEEHAGVFLVGGFGPEDGEGCGFWCGCAWLVEALPVADIDGVPVLLELVGGVYGVGDVVYAGVVVAGDSSFSDCLVDVVKAAGEVGVAVGGGVVCFGGGEHFWCGHGVGVFL